MATWKQKRQLMHQYDRTSYLYEVRYSKEQNLKITAILERISLKKGDLVADLGCGTGLLLRKFEEEKGITVVGIDISRSMLSYAKQSLRDSSSVHLILADADNIPIRDNCFSYSFAITLLQNMPNLSSTLKEMKRITTSSASIIITGLKKCFTEGSFLNFLHNAQLKPKLLVARDTRLKCHIAVCLK